MDITNINAHLKIAIIKDLKVVDCVIMESLDESVINFLIEKYNADSYLDATDTLEVSIGSIVLNNKVLPFKSPEIASFIWDSEENCWKPPVSKPETGMWIWDETVVNWVEPTTE
jgi:hypothetical protein